MIRNAALTVLALAAFAPGTAAAQDVPAPTMSTPTVSRSGAFATTLTLPAGGTYALKVLSGRAILCRVKQKYRPSGTHRVACRVRSGALKRLRQRLEGSGTLTFVAKFVMSVSVNVGSENADREEFVDYELQKQTKVLTHVLS